MDWIVYEMKKEQKAVKEKEEEQKKENEETPKEDPSPEKETPSKEEDNSLQALLGFSNFKAKRRWFVSMHCSFLFRFIEQTRG